MTKQKQLDSESILFITHVMEKYNNPFSLFWMKVKAVWNLASYLFTVPTGELKALMQQKLTTGGLEHGRPYYPDISVPRNELIKEHLDELGWPEIALWQKVRLEYFNGKEKRSDLS